MGAEVSFTGLARLGASATGPWSSFRAMRASLFAAVGPVYTAPAHRYGFRRGLTTHKRLVGPSWVIPADLTIVAKAVVIGGDVFQCIFSVTEGSMLLALRIGSTEVQALAKQAGGTQQIASLTFAAIGVGWNHEDGEEHTYALIVDGTSLTLRVDGVSSAPVTLTGGLETGTVTAGITTIGDNATHGAQDLTGAIACAVVGRALTAGEIDAVDTMLDLVDDPDLLLCPRTSAQAFTVGSTYEDVANVSDWARSASGSDSGWTTENGSERSRVVVIQDQSNSRTTDVAYSGLNTLLSTNAFLSDPATNAGTIERMTDWASSLNPLHFDGPEVAILHEAGTIPRILLKAVDGGTDIDYQTATLWPYVQTHLARGGLTLDDGVWLYAQGEADSQNSTDAADFLDKLRTLVGLVETAYPTVSVILSSTPGITDTATYTHFTDTNAHKATVAGEGVNRVYLDNTAQLVQADGVHRTEAAVVTYGGMVADAVVAFGVWDAP